MDKLETFLKAKSTHLKVTWQPHRNAAGRLMVVLYGVARSANSCEAALIALWSRGQLPYSSRTNVLRAKVSKGHSLSKSDLVELRDNMNMFETRREILESWGFDLEELADQVGVGDGATWPSVTGTVIKAGPVASKAIYNPEDKTVLVNIKVLKTTEKAWQIKFGGHVMWVPKSVCQMIDKPDGSRDIMVPNWKLKSEGVPLS